MRAAYADPPYLGCCGYYDHEHGDDDRCWDEPLTHSVLIGRLRDFDAWAMSASSTSLQRILRLCPDDDLRVGAWVKTFASFKPNVNPAYAWEPVIFSGGRKRGRGELTIRDWVSAPITLERGTVGAKPEKFCRWVFDLLGLTPDDEFVDLFPGSGAVGRAWDRWCRERPLWEGGAA